MTGYPIVEKVSMETEPIEWSAEEENCVRELSLNRDLIRGLNRGIVLENHDDFNDFRACYFKRKGYQNEDGEVLYENLKEALGRAIIMEAGTKTTAAKVFSHLIALQIVNSCKYIKGESHGDTAVKVQNCMMRNYRRFIV